MNNLFDFSTLKKMIDSWDPLQLLKSGAPQDEYDSEIQSIAAGLRNCVKAKDVQELIYNTFKDSFGEESAGDISLYSKIAEEIFTKIKLI